MNGWLRSLRRRRTALTLALASLWLLPVLPGIAQNVPSNLLAVDSALEGPLPAGSYAILPVRIEIHPAWHVNANPPSEEFMVPTVVEVTLPDGLSAGEVRYPKGKSLPFAFSDVPLDVYEHEAVLQVPIAADESLAPGEYEYTGQVQYQACDDQVCLAPAFVEFGGVIVVAEEGSETPLPLITAAEFESAPVAGAAGTGEVFTGPQDGAPAAAVENPIDEVFENNALLAYLTVFGFGLALNLTPCVYPMMSVTIALFGSREEKSPLARLPAATTYVLGIAFMYSALGLLAAFTGTLFGSFLQHPAVLIGIGVILAAMALSMFGLYEMQMPSSILSRVGGQETAGLVGVFLSGLMVGVFAAPCIGPPIVALLAVVGQSGDALFGFLVFFVLSIGLGAPYLLLATYGGMMQKLPRSGAWMVWVKKLFGVVLLAVALFYVSLAIRPEWSDWVVPVALVLGGLYLGFFERTGDEAKPFAWGKRLAGLAAVVGGVYLVVTAPSAHVAWEPYSPDRLELAQQSGQPVILDFYATWCIPCKELDHQTFSDAEVISLSKRFTTLKVDLTSYDSPESEQIRNRFQIAGVPTIVFLDPAGNEIAGTRVVGFVNADEFAALTRRALGEEMSATKVEP